MSVKVNERVGAVASIHNGVMTLFGYGTYAGEQVPETDDVKLFGFPLKKLNMVNPKIVLDSGEFVWGCECWWASEEKVKEMEANAKKVQLITPTEYRNL